MSTELLLLSEVNTLKLMLENLSIPQKEFLNVEEAANYLCISKSTLYKLTSSKKIVYYKPNNKISLFKIEDLKNFIEKGRVHTLEEYSSIAEKMIENFKN